MSSTLDEGAGLAEAYEWIHPVSLLVLRDLEGGAPMNIRQISERMAPILGLENPYGTVRRRVDRLEAAGLVESEKAGNQRVVRFKDNYLSSAAIELSERLKFQEAILRAGEGLANVAVNFVDHLSNLDYSATAYFYGSFAKGTAHPGTSDLDVLLIVPDEKEEAAEQVKSKASNLSRAFERDLHLDVAKKSNFEDMKREGDPIVGQALDGIKLRFS